MSCRPWFSRHPLRSLKTKTKITSDLSIATSESSVTAGLCALVFFCLASRSLMAIVIKLRQGSFLGLPAVPDIVVVVVVHCLLCLMLPWREAILFWDFTPNQILSSLLLSFVCLMLCYRQFKPFFSFSFFFFSSFFFFFSSGPSRWTRYCRRCRCPLLVLFDVVLQTI